VNNTQQSNNAFVARFHEVGLRHATELRILLSGFGGACAPEQLTPESREFVKAWARGWAKGFGLSAETATAFFAQLDAVEAESYGHDPPIL
jgi:hypothetical protein